MYPTKRLKSRSRPSATMNSEFVTQSKMSIKNIELPGDKITEFCKRWKIQELALFGSVLRSDFQPNSDIDVLVKEIKSLFDRDVNY